MAAAGCHQLGQGFGDGGLVGIGSKLDQRRVKAERHDGAVLGAAFPKDSRAATPGGAAWAFRRRHQHGGCADGAVGAPPGRAENRNPTPGQLKETFADGEFRVSSWGQSAWGSSLRCAWWHRWKRVNAAVSPGVRQRMTGGFCDSGHLVAHSRFSALGGGDESVLILADHQRPCAPDRRCPFLPSSPSYFLRTASRRSRPGRRPARPTVTDTPPAPKSLQRRIMRGPRCCASDAGSCASGALPSVPRRPWFARFEIVAFELPVARGAAAQQQHYVAWVPGFPDHIFAGAATTRFLQGAGGAGW